jgi:hypothetical protein
VYHFGIKKPTKIMLKLANDVRDTQFVLALLKESTPNVIPLYGKIVPKPYVVGTTKSGRLDGYESHYFVTDLPPGKYKVFFDMAVPAGEGNNNLIGQGRADYPAREKRSRPCQLFRQNRVGRAERGRVKAHRMQHATPRADYKQGRFISLTDRVHSRAH